MKKRINSLSLAQPQPLSLFHFIFGNFELCSWFFFRFAALLLLFGRKQFPFHFGCFCASASMQSLLFSFSFACVFCVCIFGFSLLSFNYRCCCCCCLPVSACLLVCRRRRCCLKFFLFFLFSFFGTKEFMYVYSLAAARTK